MGGSSSTPSPIAAIPDLTYCDMTYTACNTITNKMSVTCVANPTVGIPEATTNHYLQSILQIDNSVIPDGVTLTDVTVHAKFFHDYPGDLIMGLYHGSAAIELFGNSGPGCDNPSALPDNIDVTFDDAATAGPITGASCAGCTGGYCGSYKPTSSLLAFNTLTANGQWILEMADTAAGDVGTFGEWTLTFTLPSHCTAQPTTNPTKSPTKNPSLSPTTDPTISPTKNPTISPTRNPTLSPSENPTLSPSDDPSSSPSKRPTDSPTDSAPVETPSPTNAPIVASEGGEDGDGGNLNANDNDSSSDMLILVFFTLLGIITASILCLIVFCWWNRKTKKELIRSMSEKNLVSPKQSNMIAVDVVSTDNTIPVGEGGNQLGTGNTGNNNNRYEEEPVVPSHHAPNSPLSVGSQADLIPNSNMNGGGMNMQPIMSMPSMPMVFPPNSMPMGNMMGMNGMNQMNQMNGMSGMNGMGGMIQMNGGSLPSPMMMQPPQINQNQNNENNNIQTAGSQELYGRNQNNLTAGGGLQAGADDNDSDEEDNYGMMYKKNASAVTPADGYNDGGF